MPVRYRPEYRWQIDWNGNGAYDHPLSDITDYLTAYDVKHGCDPTVAVDAVVPATAIGHVSLDNYDRRYDPDSSARQVARADLVAQRKARCLIGGARWWEGIATYDRKNPTGGREIARWQLDGAHGRKFRDHHVITYEGGTVADLVAAVAEQTGVPFSGASQQPVGNVHHDGNLLSFYEALGNYAGGFVLETDTGGMMFVSYANAASLPIGDGFDESYELLEDLVRRGLKPQHSRSEAVVDSFVWVEDRNEDGTEKVQTMADVEVVLTTGHPRFVFVDQDPTSSWRPKEWRSFEVTSSDTAAAASAVTFDDDNINRVVVRITPPALPNITAKVRLKGMGIREVSESAVRRLVVNPDFAGEPRTLQVPPWFPADYEGVTTYVRPWLHTLAIPPQHMTVAYRGWQTTMGRAANVAAHSKPGRHNQYTVRVNDQPVVVDALVLQTRLRWREHNPPVHIMDTVATSDIAPPRVFADARSTGIGTAQVLAGVVNPTGQTVYERHRTA